MGLDISSLEAELQQAESKVNAWAAQRLQTANTQRDNHITAVHHAKAKLNKLKETEAQMLQNAAELEQRLEKERAQETKLTNELSKVQEAEGALVPQIESLEAKISGLQAKSDAEKHELDQKLQEHTQRLQHLQTAQTEFFRARLGLRFDRTPDQVLRIVFTKLDPANAEREFVVGVQVLEDDVTYAVRLCEPQLEGLDGLLETLNSTTDLRGFVISVRSSFQALLAP